jgi:SAM-dependent methyltransferase
MVPLIRAISMKTNTLKQKPTLHAASEQHQRSWYDYPEFYELAFADETKLEADFIEAACRRYATRRVRRLLEPGCGGGRLVAELAGRGYRLSAFDNNRRSLDYLRRRLARRGLRAHVFEADLIRFRLSDRVDAAFNTYNTFRHLLTEHEARAHLRRVAHHLERGGIYILGFHLLPLDASLECTERWRGRRGATRVSYTLRVVDANRAQRWERMRVSLLVRSPKREFRTSGEFYFRLYTARQVRSLLATVPEFELCDTFDFNYEIDRPLRLNDELSDTVLILRKR